MADAKVPMYSSITNNDLDTLSKAFKDENFRKDLLEFVESISSSENRNHYETELKKYEKERGVDVQFLHPLPGFALHTKNKNGDCFFVNIAVSSDIEQPNITRDERRGLKISIPLAIPEPRLEFSTGKIFSEWLSQSSPEVTSYLKQFQPVISKFNKVGVKVIDVIVNPLCVEFSKRHCSLREYVISSLLSNVKSEISINLSVEFVLPFGLYVGTPSTSQIKKVIDSQVFNESLNSLAFLSHNLNSQDNYFNHIHSKEYQKNNYEKQRTKNNNVDENINFEKGTIRPSYELKYIDHLNLQDYSLDLNRVSTPLSLRPKGLLLKFNLHGVQSATEIDIKASGKSCILSTDGKFNYHIDIHLPYAVEENPKYAKFDIVTNILEIEFIVDKSCSSSSPIDRTSDFLNETTSKLEASPESVPKEQSQFNETDENDLTYIDETEKGLIKDNLTFHQCDNSFLFNIALNNNKIKNINLNEFSIEDFVISYSFSQDFPNQNQIYVSVAPYSFVKNSLSTEISQNKIVINIQKSHSGIWEKLKIGRTKETADEIFVSGQINRLTECSSSSELSTILPDKTDKEANNSSLTLLPYCVFDQTEEFLFIKINGGTTIQNFEICSLDSKTFKFFYKCLGNGLFPLLYGAIVSTAPYAIKNQGISYSIDEGTIIISVAKKKNVRWPKIKVGQELRNLKVIKLRSSENGSPPSLQHGLINEIYSCSSETESKLDQITATDDSTEFSDVENKENCFDGENTAKHIKLQRSSSVYIPGCSKENSFYFLTGSWPRGILKSRARSLSESHADSVQVPTAAHLSSSLEGPETDDDKASTGMDEAATSSSAKKSVRFNEFVCQQIFRKNGSILGQRRKNQKRVHDRKRARDSKMSEGSQSSGTETENEASLAESKSQTIPKKRPNKYNKNGKSKNSKPVLNISNDLVFQLDDD